MTLQNKGVRVPANPNQQNKEDSNMTKNEKIEQTEAATNWFKKAHEGIKSILTINQRLKQLEDIHFGTTPHPADICPGCGAHSLRQCIEHVHETVFMHQYEHTQNTVLFCTAPDCTYRRVIDERTVKTNVPMTDNPKPKGMNIKRI